SGAPSASSVTGSGAGSSGGLFGWLFGAGSGSAANALSNATINVASATINAGGAGTLGGSGGGGLFSGLGSFFSDLFGGRSDILGGAAAAPDPASFFGFAGLGFAKGGIFDRARRFAAGSIVQDPTYFNIGLMGESGPESIMPLTRTAGGQLGVRAAG